MCRVRPGSRFATALTLLLVVCGPALAEDAVGASPRPLAGFVLGAGRVLPTRGIDPAGMTWGFGVGVDYEWAHARIASTLFAGGGGSWSSSALRFSIDWLPLAGDWTPYVGAGGGLALIGKKQPYEPNGEQLLPPYLNALPMVSVEAGFEFFRNRARRLLLGLDLELPWSQPFECSPDLSSCGKTWRLRYPEVAVYARIML